jgi:hypothetical protein
MKRQEIKIPDNGKVIIKDNKIIIEYEEEKSEQFKNGQFLTDRKGKDRWSIIFKDKKYETIDPFEYYVMLNCRDEITYNGTCSDKGWYESTESEKQELLKALHRRGKDWDPENLQIIDYIWKPKSGETYFQPSIYNDSLFLEITWDNTFFENKLFKHGLVFKTKMEAIACAKKMLKCAKN